MKAFAKFLALCVVEAWHRAGYPRLAEPYVALYEGREDR